MCKTSGRSIAFLLLILFLICEDTQGLSLGRAGGSKGSGSKSGGSHGSHSGVSHGHRGTHSFSGGHKTVHTGSHGSAGSQTPPIIHHANPPPPIGWNIPPNRPQTPIVAVNRPIVNSQPHGGVSQQQQSPPAYNPALAHNTGHRHPANSINITHAPIQPHYAPSQQSPIFVGQPVYTPRVVQPQTVPHYQNQGVQPQVFPHYQNPQTVPQVVHVPVPVQQPMVVQQDKKSSKLGLGTGLAAGALAGAVVGHLLTPTNNHPTHQPVTNDRDRVIIINNTPGQAAPVQQGVPNNPQPNYVGQPTNIGQPISNGQPVYPGQPIPNVQPTYNGQSSYTGQPTSTGQPSYTGQPGYNPPSNLQAGNIVPHPGQPGYTTSPNNLTPTNCYIMNVTETDPTNPANLKVIQREVCQQVSQQNQIPQNTQPAMQPVIPQYPQPGMQYPQPGMQSGIQPAIQQNPQPAMQPVVPSAVPPTTHVGTQELHHAHHHKHSKSGALKTSPLSWGTVFAFIAIVIACV